MKLSRIVDIEPDLWREPEREGLRAELGDTDHVVKTVMQWTGANEPTVKEGHAQQAAREATT